MHTTTLPDFSAIDIKNFPQQLAQKLADNRKFIDALLLIIWCNPSLVRWALLFISNTTCLNNKKDTAAAFWVNK